MTGKITTYKPAGAPLRILTNQSDGIHPPPRKLTAKWTMEPEKPPFPLKGVKEMNEEEQADEIIRRLSQPYKTPAEQIEESMMAVLSSEIAKEIDNDIMTEMMRRYFNSGTHGNAKESNT